MRVGIVRLADFFFPTKRNHYHPGIFKKEPLIAIAAALLFFQAAYFASVFVAFKNPNFLAAVLPGALTALTNTDRAQNGVQELTEDSLLVKAAQEKADDMAAKGYFSHVTPDGKTPWYWLDQVGYRYTYAGENLAVNFTDSKDVEDAWMKSPAHHANLVKPEFTQIGIAVASGIYKGQNATFVVQFFGTPAAAAVPVSPPSFKEQAPPLKATSSSGRVLGATTGAPPAVPASAVSNSAENNSAHTVEKLAASPNRTLALILGIFLSLFAVLLFLAIFIQVRIQYLSVIGGGLLLLFLSGGLFLANEKRLANAHVELPTDTNAAAIYVGFSKHN